MNDDMVRAGSGVLSPYAGGMEYEAPRVEALALISAGYRSGGERGLPKSSQPADEKKIHLHDPHQRAPGLLQAIEAGDHKRLLITFPLDRIDDFIVQRFTRYSATRLEVYGDQYEITEIEQRGDSAQHRRYQAGTDEYQALVATCKADTRIFFCLAEWVNGNAEIVFPDGLGMYAIRTTSLHSVRSIRQSIEYTAGYTRGRIAGLPFTLEIVHREVAGPNGVKRTIPVWTAVCKPPEGVRLSGESFGKIKAFALRQSEMLMLPAPSALTAEDFAEPIPEAEPSMAELALMAQGGPCDYDRYIKMFHAQARGTAFEGDEARAAFISAYTEGSDTSLSSFLHRATEEEAQDMLTALSEAVTRSLVGKFNQIFKSEEQLDTAADIPTVRSVDHKMWQGYIRLMTEADKLGTEYEVPTLPIPEAELDKLGKALKAEILAARAMAQVEQDSGIQGAVA